MFIPIIDPIHQRVFNGDFATIVGHLIQIALGAIDKCLQRIFAVNRDQFVAQLIIRRVQTDRQRYITDIAELINFGNHTRSTQGDTALREAVGIIIEHQVHGIDNIVKIHQWLAHTHHHHIGDSAFRFGIKLIKGFCGDPQLANNFSGGQIAIKTLLSGSAETAIQSTANLRRDTEGSAIALGNINHFNTAAAIHADQPFAGSINRVLDTNHLWQNDFSHFAKAGAQTFRDIGHLVDIGDTLLVYPLENLGSTKTLLAE